MANKKTKSSIVGKTLLAAVAHKKIDLIKEYLEPTGLTITEMVDRNSFASLCQLLDAYLLEAVREVSNEGNVDEVLPNGIDSEKPQKVNVYLLSFTLGIGDEYPICYELIYAENYENAKNKLKEKHQRVYEIDDCTIL